MTIQRSTNYYTFDPEVLGGYLSAGDWNGCWTYICEIVESLSSVKNISVNLLMQKDLEVDENRRRIEAFGKLLGELVYTLLDDEGTRIPDKCFYRLITSHESIHNLIYLFGGVSPQDSVNRMISQKKELSEAQQKRLALLIDLRQEQDIVSNLRRIDGKYRMAAVVAFLNYVSIADHNVYENKIKTYALRHDLVKAYGDLATLMSAVTAYFNCSYLDTPDRHVIKDSINKAFQLYIKNSERELKRSRVSADSINAFSHNGKPRMIVVMDFLYRNHAMTRSWAEWIKSLSSEFDVTIMANKSKAGDDISDLFEKIVLFQNVNELVAFAKMIIPEVCIFPSVGMTFFSVIASNMRLAPLQIMGLGHPATSYSPFIDFVYGPKEMYSPEAFPTDRYIVDNAPYKFFPILSREEILSIQPHQTPREDNVIRVSVVGSNVKISAPFIKLLKEIEQESSYSIHFNFHIGSVGLDTLCMQKYLRTQFKNISYSGFRNYRDYLMEIKEADIVLNPFPFGHTNTLIDTLLMGIPCVGLQGNEPSSQTERYILNIVGLADRFSATSIEDYKQKFTAIVREIKGGNVAAIDRGQIYDQLYGDHVAYDFGKIIKWVYDRRKEMLSSKERVFQCPISVLSD